MKRNVVIFVFAPIALAIFLGFVFISGCGTGGGGGSAPQPFVADIYVSTTGSDESGDGSLSKPYRTIIKALSVVSPEGTIGVMEGIYQEGNITWPGTANVTLKGASKTGTIVDGDNYNNKLFRIWGISSSIGGLTIESMTIREGYIYGSGGAIFHNVDVPLHAKNIVFWGNRAAFIGGAVRVSNGSFIAENCSFSGNEVTDAGVDEGGGAVYVDTGKTFIAVNCIFENNSVSPESGGAIYNNSGTIDLKKCSIKNNTAYINGGGIYNTGTNATGRVENCLIYKNKTGFDNGGGICDSSSTTLEIVNCDIVSNEATNNGGGIWGSNTTRISNCIIWGNSAGGLSPDLDACATPYIEYSDLTDWSVLPVSIVIGPGTVEADPDFVGFPPSVDNDLRLDSPPISVSQGGTTEGAPLDDFDGNPRTAPYSMGAFEY